MFPLKRYIYQELVQIRNNLLLELEHDLDQKLAKELVNYNKHIFEHLGPMLIIAYTKQNSGYDKAKDFVIAIYLLLLAHHIHQNRKELNNFNLLLGDYCFSKFYNYLIQRDLQEWITVFSQLICQLQEAAVIKTHNNLQNLSQSLTEEMVDKDYANLCSLCSYIGASLNHLKRSSLIEHQNFGLNLGRTYYLCQLGLAPSLAKLFLAQATSGLVLINDSELQYTMFKLLNFLGTKINKSLKKELAF